MSSILWLVFRSGTAEQYTEKDVLLDGVTELYKNEMSEKASANETRKEESEKADADRRLGLSIRESAVRTLKDKEVRKGMSTNDPASSRLSFKFCLWDYLPGLCFPFPKVKKQTMCTCVCASGWMWMSVSGCGWASPEFECFFFVFFSQTGVVCVCVCVCACECISTCFCVYMLCCVVFLCACFHMAPRMHCPHHLLVFTQNQQQRDGAHLKIDSKQLSR